MTNELPKLQYSYEGGNSNQRKGYNTFLRKMLQQNTTICKKINIIERLYGALFLFTIDKYLNLWYDTK